MQRISVSSATVVRVIVVAVATLAAMKFLLSLRPVLFTLAMAGFLAMVLGPAVDFFAGRLRLPRAAAILSVYACLGVGVGLVGVVVVPPVADGVDSFAANAPSYIDQLRESEAVRAFDDKYDLTAKLQAQAGQLPAKVAQAAGALGSVTVGVFSALFQLITVLVLCFFLLMDGRRLLAFAFAQLPEAQRPRAQRLSAAMYRAVGGWAIGALFLAVCAGLSAWLVMIALGIPYAVPLAVFMGFMALIPMVGATVAGAAICLVAFLHSSSAGVVWLVFFLLYQQLENNVLQPYVYRRTIALHALTVIPAVLVGAQVLGILGALIAIPVAASLQILVKDWWASRPPAPAPAPAPAPPMPPA